MKDTDNQGKSLQERLAEAEERRKNATISDIIAAKRREADSIEQSARGTFKVGYSWDDLPFTEGDLERELDNAARIRKEADRLETALKRELAAYEQTMGKLRDALAKIRSEAYECDQGGEYLGEGSDPGFDRIIKMCDAALATASNQNTQVAKKIQGGN